jgi:spore coat polysaccharide biosynthesis protein SpsF
MGVQVLLSPLYFVMKSIFISVRSNSTRLPNKATADICGKKSIEYLIDNLKRSQESSDIVLCTTTSYKDDILCDIASDKEIRFFRGSEEDKLQRWLGACKEFNIEMFAECGGDDIFCDYRLIDLVLKEYELYKPDFIDGKDLYNDVYGMTRDLLEKVCHQKKDEILETHEVSDYIKSSKVKYHRLKNVSDIFQKRYRLTLDYKEDLDFFRTVVKSLDNEFELEDIIELLDSNPEIASMNLFLEDEWRDNQNK